MSSTLASMYFRSSVLYALLGMAMGIHMAASHDHSQMPTHAHLMLFGWVGMTIYAVFYRLYPDAGSGILVKIHAVLAHGALIGLVAGLFLIYGGQIATGEPIASISSILLLLNMVLFGVIVWKATR
ncbi:MAG: hypothetical protein R8L07_16065 [Alphaproteobacteria bacterium]|nr:hypothetical protein [Alphaproteobacteria bacterium]